MRPSRILYVLTACCLVLAGCGVNSSIRIADGEKVDGGKTTVNGGVYIGAGCEVRGTCRTVNGRVSVGANSQVQGLQTVNGSIKLAENVSVEGDLGTVNGSITLAENVSVEGDVDTVNGSFDCAGGGSISGTVGTVNGSIRLVGLEVGGSLITANGNISLEESSRVAGDIVIKGKSKRNRQPREITITGGSVVEGDIIVRDARRKVTVILSDGGQVKGEIRNAEVIEE